MGNMENITDVDNTHAFWVCKDFEIKAVGEYHGLYFLSDTLLLVDVFNNLWNMCLGIDPAYKTALKRPKYNWIC